MRIVNVIFILLFSLALFAENDKGTKNKGSETQISGKVIDHLTGENLAGVKIQVLDTDLVVYTDLDGNFSLIIPNSIENKQIQVSYISYETLFIPFDKVMKTGEIKIIPVSR